MSKILSMLLFVPVAAYAAASAPAVTNGQTEQMAVQAAVAFDGAEASVQAPVSAVTLSDDGLVLTGREMVDSYGLIRHRRIHCALRPGFCRHHPAQTVEVWRNTYQIVDRDRYVYTQKRKWEAWGAVIGAIPGLAAAAFIGAFLGAPWLGLGLIAAGAAAGAGALIGNYAAGKAAEEKPEVFTETEYIRKPL